MQFTNNFSKLCYFSIPLIAVCFFVGLFSHGTGDLDLFVLLSGLLALAAIVLWPSFKTGHWQIPKSAVVLSLLVYWAVVWGSVFFSTYVFNSILFALIFSVLPFVFLMIVLSADPWRWLGRFAWGLGFGVVVLALFAALQFFVLEPGLRVHLPMRNPNNLSVIFNMALFPALGFYALAQDRQAKLLAALLLCLLALGFLVTQSRAALLSFGIAVFVFFLVVRWAGFFSWSRLIGFLLGFGILYAVINLAGNGYLFDSMERLADVGGGAIKTPSVYERLLIWQSTWALIQDHFWTGTGLGTFIYFYPRYRDAQDMSGGFFAHMDPLQFCAEMGVFGAIAFYAVAISILCRTIYVAMRADKKNPKLVWMYACFCGLLVLFLHTHLSFHLYIPVILFVAAVLLAGWYLCGEALLGEKRIKFALPSFARVGGIAVSLALIGFTAFWMMRVAYAYHYVGLAAGNIQKGEIGAAREHLDKTAVFTPKNFSSYYHYEADYYLNVLRRSNEGREELYHKALGYVDQAIAYNRGFVFLWNLKAQIYFTGAGDLEPDGVEKAIALLEDSVAADPCFYDARYGLAYVYRQRGMTAEARALMAEAVDLKCVQRYLKL